MGPISAEILAWSHPESLRRLSRADAGPAFYALTNHFESQTNKFSCAICSAVIVLNALRADNPAIEKPCDPSLFSGPRENLPAGLNPVFRRYSQGNFLNDRTERLKTRHIVFGGGSTADGCPTNCGLQLHELAAILVEGYGVRCQTIVAAPEKSDDELRRGLVRALRQAGSYVIANYSREPLGQGRASHVSPLGAYDEISDSFLVLDVNPSVAPWAWVPAARLIEAMRRFDTVAARGFLVIQEA